MLVREELPVQALRRRRIQACIREGTAGIGRRARSQAGVATAETAETSKMQSTLEAKERALQRMLRAAANAQKDEMQEALRQSLGEWRADIMAKEKALCER